MPTSSQRLGFLHGSPMANGECAPTILIWIGRACITSAQHWQVGRWNARIPGAKLPRHLLQIQPDQNASSRWGKNDIHYRTWQLLLQGHAIRPQKCKHDIPTTNGLSLQTTYRMKRRGICWWHGCQVSKHTLICGEPWRSIRGATQIWHVPKPWKMYFWGRQRQVPRLHDHTPGDWSQPRQMHYHTRDAQPNQHTRSLEVQQ